MDILWLNWRDIKHPEAGGAEVFTHELMRRLVQHGYDITFFCPKVEGRQDKELVDGVSIVRGGGKYTVYSRGKSYFKKHRNSYDMVIDEVNPIPFLNPRVLKGKPALVLFHQMIREEWFYEMPFPLSYICNFYENMCLARYRETPTLTVSASSKKDLEEIGFKNVGTIPMGIDTKPLERVGRKEDSPTVVFLGRLKRHKLPDHAIRAFQIIKKEIPVARMWVIGDGDMLNKLKRLGIRDVTFRGHVENKLKYDLLSRAHLVLVPSVKEGWGMVVTESNAMGTPVIAYDVNGLRDSVDHGNNGILVDDNSPESLARSALALLKNQEVLARYSESALKHSRQFDFDKSTRYFATQIEKAVGNT